MPFQNERTLLDTGVEVFAVSGTLTMGSQLQSLEWALQDAFRTPNARIVLDMSGVSYIDSAAIGVIVASNGIAGESGGQFRLCGITDRVRNILSLTGVQAILNLDTTRDASVTALCAKAGHAG